MSATKVSKAPTKKAKAEHAAKVKAEPKAKPAPAPDCVPCPLLTEETAAKISDAMKAVADPLRLRILQALSLAESAVTPLASSLGATQPALSHSLKQLKLCGLAKFRAVGRQKHYSLTEKGANALGGALSFGL